MWRLKLSRAGGSTFRWDFAAGSTFVLETLSGNTSTMPISIATYLNSNATSGAITLAFSAPGPAGYIISNISPFEASAASGISGNNTNTVVWGS